MQKCLQQQNVQMNSALYTGDVTLDFQKVQERKESIVEQLHRGVQHLMKKGKIDVFEGKGRILGPSIFSPTPGTISVERTDGEENTMLIPKYVSNCYRLLATYFTRSRSRWEVCADFR